MEEKQENVVEETTEQKPSVKEEPKIDDTVEKIKIKKKPSMKKFSNDPDGVTKIDLNKPQQEEEKTEKVEEEGKIKEVVDKKEVVVEDKEQPVVEEITVDGGEQEVEAEVTEEQVMFWVGNEGYGDKQIEDMLDTIMLIANGKYSPDELREDIINFQDEGDEDFLRAMEGGA